MGSYNMQKQKGNQHSNPDHKVDVVDGQFVLARVSFDPLLVAEVLPSSPRGRKLSAVLLVPHSDWSSSAVQCSGAGSGAVHYGVSVLPLANLQVQYFLAGTALLCVESVQIYRHSTYVWRISISGAVVVQYGVSVLPLLMTNLQVQSSTTTGTVPLCVEYTVLICDGLVCLVPAVVLWYSMVYQYFPWSICRSSSTTAGSIPLFVEYWY